VTFSLREFNLKKQMCSCWVFHVDDRSESSNTFGMIIGRDILGELGTSMLLIVHEGIYNDTDKHSMLSEFHLRDFRVKLTQFDKHGGTQKMVIQDVGSSLVIPLELAGCMIHFKH
jgi:hypothetical protein